MGTVSTITIHLDFARDLIQMLPANDDHGGAGGTSNAALAYDGPTAQDVAITIEIYTGSPAGSNSGPSSGGAPIDSASANSSSGSGSSCDPALDTLVALGDSGHSGSQANSGTNSGNGGNAADHIGQGSDAPPAVNDNIIFMHGYGNDAAVPVADNVPVEDAIDPVAAAFEALQFANALCAAGNDDVMIFDTSNVVTIRSFHEIGTPDTILT